MLVDSALDDVVLTSALTGLPTNVLKASLPADLLSPIEADMMGLLSKPTSWKDISSGGHSVSGVEAVLSVADLVSTTIAEYQPIRT
jgi:nitronate monooxygenase